MKTLTIINLKIIGEIINEKTTQKEMEIIIIFILIPHCKRKKNR